MISSVNIKIDTDTEKTVSVVCMSEFRDIVTDNLRPDFHGS